MNTLTSFKPAQPLQTAWNSVGTNRQTLRKKPSEVVTGKLCQPTAERITARDWENAIDACESLQVSQDDAIAHCERAMSLAQSFGQTDSRYLQTLLGLGGRIRTTDPGRAESLHREALAIARQDPGSNTRGVFHALIGIAYIRQKSLDWASSLPYYEQAIEFGRRRLGTSNIEVMVNMMLLGKLYLDHGKTTEAKQWLSATLEAASSKATAHWLLVNNIAANSARFLAEAHQAEGNLAEAQRYREIQQQHKARPKNLEKESNGLVDTDDAG